MTVKFFKSQNQFRQWLEKHHAKSSGLWLGFNKDHSGIRQSEAIDQAICFGWTSNIIKRIDEFTYKSHFMPRKEKSQWSAGTLKRAEALRKRGLMHTSGISVLKNRQRHEQESGVAEFSPSQAKKFKANVTAWSWYSTQTKSYRYYTTAWVIRAKRNETKEKRLEMLIADSAQGQKLGRIAAAIEKVKPKYPVGATPIEAGKNLGLATGAELRSVGLETLENLKSLGWEKAFYRLVEMYPHRLNMNMLKALIGAVENVSSRALGAELQSEAKRVLQEARESLRGNL
jgi:uncharacterized protein YdeI (YjbR/CyaY-like superfamily)